MKLTTEEHLNRILAKCKSLREAARKRSPGEWRLKSAQREIGQSGDFETEHFLDASGKCITNGWNLEDEDIDNFAFIASCAGPAEAGWEATIAAIEYIRSDAEIFGENTPRGQATRSQLNAIIAAWPEELLS